MARLAEVANHSMPHKPTSVKNVLLETAVRHGNKTAVVALHQAADLYPGVSAANGSTPYLRWTYSELLHGARLLAAALRERGIRKGDPVASFLHNGADWALSFWAAALLGCPWVAIQPRTAANTEELAHILAVSKPQVLLVWDAEQFSQFQDSARIELEAISVKALCSSTSPIPLGWEVLGAMLDSSPSPLDVRHDDPQTVAEDTALLLFTSGTTGLPKGCVHTNSSLTHMLRNHAQSLGLDETSSSVSHLTLAHCFGLLYSCSFWITGGKVVYSNAGFDPKSTLEALRLESCTHMPAVPSLLYALLDSVNENTMHAIQHIEFSGAMVSEETTEQARRQLGVAIVSAHYGMTESGPAALWPGEGSCGSTRTNSASPGLPVSGGMLRICAPGSRVPLKRGEAGEIHQKSPQLIRSYLEDVAADHFYDDEYGRWMLTGDQGIMLESGEIEVCGRYKDLIIRGGENISPAQIEAVLNENKDVNAQVVGAPDNLLGEVPIAVLQQADFATDSHLVKNMRELVVEKLGPTFTIDQVISLKDLGLKHFPQTCTGKVKKVELAQLVKEFRQPLYRRDSGTDGALVNAAPLSPNPIDAVQLVVCAVWAQILGIEQSRLQPESNIATMADSLTVMQARRLFRKQGMEITLPQLLAHPTIAAQTEFFSQPKTTQVATPLRVERTGPPTSFDMAETAGDETRAKVIESCATSLLEKHGLSWQDDVEDVLPMADILANMAAMKRRTRSAMRRDAFYARGVSPTHLVSAVKTALGYHAPLRSMWFPTSATAVSQLVVRPSERSLDRFVEKSNVIIDNLEDLATVWAGHEQLDVCASQKGPGALFRAVVFGIKSEPGSSGLVYWSNHAAFDATSLSYFRETIDEVLAIRTLTPRINYKLFAEAHHAGRTSALAQAGAKYLESRVHGFASYSAEATVPRARAPCYLIGNDTGWLDPATNLPGDPAYRVPLDGPSSTAIATNGLVRVLTLPGLQTLQSTQNIPAHIVLKATLAIANSLWTGHTRAFFRSLVAARSWPFLSPTLAAHLPSVDDVAGPTLAASFESFDFAADTDETLGAFLLRLKAEQRIAKQYEHTPLGLALATLQSDDRAALMERGLSQLFNYLPNVEQDSSSSVLQQVQNEMNADTGLHWDFTNLCGGNIRIHVRWDACQLYRREVEQMLADLESVASWASEDENWEGKVSEVRGWKSRYQAADTLRFPAEHAFSGRARVEG